MCLVYFVHFLFNYNIFLAVLQDVIKRDCLLVALVNQKMKKYKEVLYMDKVRKEEIKSAYICNIGNISGAADLRKELYSSNPYAFMVGYAPDITVYEAYQIIGEIRDSLLGA